VAKQHVRKHIEEELDIDAEIQQELSLKKVSRGETEEERRNYAQYLNIVEGNDDDWEASFFNEDSVLEEGAHARPFT